MAEDKAETGRRLNVTEAAAELGTTVEGVRSRIKRGTLRTERESGRVFVIVEDRPDADPRRPGADQTTDRALVDELKDRVAFLERELERRGEAEAELRRIIAALTQRIPELEAPETPSEPAPEAEPGTERAPWWRRWFQSL
jgi:hypothetical protein